MHLVLMQKERKKMNRQAAAHEEKAESTKTCSGKISALRNSYNWHVSGAQALHIACSK